MLLFFDLQKLEQHSKTPSEFIDNLKTFYFAYYIKDASYRLKSLKSFTGYSYLLNPEPLFRDQTVDIAHKVQYVKLAARRNYSTYKLTSVAQLDLSLYPDIDIEALRGNTLLSIDQYQIKFKYEEIYNGSKVRRH